MKKIILLIIVVAGLYFAYQNYYHGSQEDVVEDTETKADTASYSQPQNTDLPASCQALAKNLENALYGSATGQVSFGQRNTAYRKLRSCLRDEGFSNAQIEDAIKGIESRTKRYLEQDGLR